MNGNSSQSLQEIWWVTKAVIPLAGVLIASVIIPLLMHYLKGRREQKYKILDIRREAYTQYFKKFEKAAEGVGQDYEEFSNVTLQDEFLKLLKSDNSPEAIVDFQKAVGEIPGKIQSSYRQATEEITGLKLIGSRELLDLTNEFEILNKEQLDQSSKWLSEFQSAIAMPNFDSPTSREMKKRGEKIGALREKIIMQMRKELGIDKET